MWCCKTLSSRNTALYFTAFKGLRVCKPPSLLEKRVCGLKRLSIVKGDQLLMLFWRPEVCHEFGCKCLPAAEVAYENYNSAGKNLSKVRLQQRYREFECA
ncbi:hypothetical protein GBAR_LOCUS10722 [Geodia barretti]|uniref:Uncharacterized protein n=1 Tax=Geodia barretti TaxID=519541 RepID=A0AA35RU30_GEOBA|nr:hypothetical protein GBAR_LOCUS10722 [Geodia barretti]